MTLSMSDEWDEASAIRHHPLAGQIPEREAIAYLVYAWDSINAGQDRTRPQYIEIADRILDCRERYYSGDDTDLQAPRPPDGPSRVQSG